MINVDKIVQSSIHGISEYERATTRIAARVATARTLEAVSESLRRVADLIPGEKLGLCGFALLLLIQAKEMDQETWKIDDDKASPAKGGGT